MSEGVLKNGHAIPISIRVIRVPYPQLVLRKYHNSVYAGHLGLVGKLDAEPVPRLLPNLGANGLNSDVFYIWRRGHAGHGSSDGEGLAGVIVPLEHPVKTIEEGSSLYSFTVKLTSIDNYVLDFIEGIREDAASLKLTAGRIVTRGQHPLHPHLFHVDH